MSPVLEKFLLGFTLAGVYFVNLDWAMFHLWIMLYDSYESYIIISSQETEPKKQNKCKWFKSRLILDTGQKVHIILWEKEERFL